MMTPLQTAPRRTVVALIAAIGAVTTFACSDFTGVPASLPTMSDSGVVYALNGAPPGAPTAVHIYSASRITADANFFFDVAFDIDAQGNPVILPQRVVASSLTASHSVALQTVTSSFANTDKAPKNGYRADTALVTRPGQVVIAESQDPNACGISITGTRLYAKFEVVSVNVAARTLNVRYTVDPNCGFLSFAPGVPKD